MYIMLGFLEHAATSAPSPTRHPTPSCPKPPTLWVYTESIQSLQNKLRPQIHGLTGAQLRNLGEPLLPQNMSHVVQELNVHNVGLFGARRHQRIGAGPTSTAGPTS